MKKGSKNLQMRLFNVLASSVLLVGTFLPTALVVADEVGATENVVVEQETTDNQQNGVVEEPKVIEEEEVKEEPKLEVEKLPKELTETPKVGEETADEEKAKVNEELVKKITILGTTDMHGNLWDYSYEDDKEANLGMARVSTVVKDVRKQVGDEKVLLVDAGDTIQGTLLTDDLYNVDPSLKDEIHPMMAGMNYIKYDSMTLGNHEFNFGIDLIKKIKQDAHFPLLSANTYWKGTENHLVEPYTVVEKDGLRIAVIGLTIPHVSIWDGEKVNKLEFESLTTEAQKQVALIKGKNEADIIVAAIHAGLDNSDPAAAARNVIKEVPEIDAFVLGHDHRGFAEHIKDDLGNDKPVGASVDTGVGVVRIDLELEPQTPEDSTEGDQADPETAVKWQVKKSTPSLIDTKTVAGDTEFRAATKSYHDKVQELVKGEIGQASASFLPENEIPGIPEAQLEPTAMISLINNVQKTVMGTDLAASALFKADSKLNAGPVTFANVFDIYKYPNTLVKANISGANLKKYLEKQAAYYNTPKDGDVTISFNPNIRVYNYDMISGVNYKIDISKPVGQRITDLTFKDAPVDDERIFSIAINNYRYSGLVTDKIITDTTNVVDSDPKTLRSEIVNYIKEKKVINPKDEITNNWEIIGVNLNHPQRAEIVSLAKEGKIKVQAAADGRTPNVKSLNVYELREQGLISKPTEEGTDSFTVMHTNDMHGRMQNDENKTIGIARVKTFKNQKKPTLLVDGGDALQGLPISNHSQGIRMAEAMKEVGYDGMTVGNHEFDFSYETAMRYKDILPIVSANIYKDGERSFDPYRIVEKEGQKFALIGLTTPETAYKTHPNNVKGVTFTEPFPEAKKVILDDIKKKHADITAYIFMTHLGVDETTKLEERGSYLAQKLSEDPELKDLNIMVFDGHSHTPLNQGMLYNQRVFLGQTGEHLNNVGFVSAKFTKDDEGKVTGKFDSKLHSAKELQALEGDKAVQDIVDVAQKDYQDAMAEILIENNLTRLNGNRENVRIRETNLGNLITDSLLEYGQSGFKQPSDFAVINGGGIRDSIEAGKITRGSVIAVLPFGNQITQIAVSGKQVKEMYEHSLRADVAAGTEPSGVPVLGSNGGFLHSSSTIKVYYDSNKKGAIPESKENPAVPGERVLRIEVKNRQTNKFELINPEKTYYLATNDFLAAGGDGYTMLGGERQEGPSMEQIVINFLKANQDLSKYKVEKPYERIIPIKEADLPAVDPGTPEKPAEVVLIETAIAESEKLEAANYTAASWTPFAEALANAKDLLEKYTAQQPTTRSFAVAGVVELKDLEEATIALKTAQSKLVLVDTETPLEEQLKTAVKALEDEIATSKEQKETDYTKETWTTFATALETAQVVLTSTKEQALTDKLVADVKTATTVLKEAREKLILVDTTTPVTEIPKEIVVALENEIAESKKLKAVDYTEKTWLVFKKALKEAEAILARVNASGSAENLSRAAETTPTVDDVEAATTTLATARQGLELVKVVPNPKPETTPSTPNQPNQQKPNGTTKPNKSNLPKTGETGNVLPLVAGLVLVTSVSGGYIFVNRKRKNDAA